MSKGPFTQLTRAAVLVSTSLVLVVAGAGMSTAYAAPTKTAPATAGPASSNADHSKGNAGTSGTYNQVQPLSTADQNTGGANGQCPGGPYCSTRDGSASGNGNQTTGQHTGEPCAGCVGKADNKNPQGQMPNGSDHNAGYECDRNNGIGQTNPAHTGCQPGATATCVASGGVTWTLTNSNAFLVTAHWVSGSDSGTVTIPAATTSGKTTTPGTVTFTTSGDSVKITFPNNNFAEIDKTADCPPPPAPVQNLGAVIYLCNALTTQAPDAGANLAIEGTAFSTQSAMLAPQSVTAGDHTVDATAPTGYHFEDCAGPQHIVTPATATEAVNVPVGETETAIFYVVQDTTPQQPQQNIAVNVFVCSTGQYSTGSTISVAGAQTFTDAANPLGPTNVLPGDYTVTANPASGFMLTDCSINGPVAPVSFTLPVGGEKTVNFYVTPIETSPGGDQTLAGVIYLCDSGHIVTGGTLSATGPQTLTDQANPFGPASVAAGDYTMTATPPAGFHLVVCNGAGSTGSETVTVPANGSGVGRFYVVPDTIQTIAGVIYVCSTGMPASGGTLSATGPQTLSGEANPFGPINVAAGDYTMTATAPTGFHLVVCNGQGSATSETVTVPVGGAGVGRFFVAPDVSPPTVTQTLAGEILVCSSGQLVKGGSLTATGANGSTTSANPYGPQMVPAGSYTVSATAPSGFHLVVCQGAGSVGAQRVSVPAGGAGVATFFVAPTVPTRVLGERIPRTPTASTPTTPGTGPSVLPFTGSDVTALLPGGLGAVLVGLLMLVAGRRRRTA